MPFENIFDFWLFLLGRNLNFDLVISDKILPI